MESESFHTGWEVIHSMHGYDSLLQTLRMSVPGGWLYRYLDTIVFVPRPADAEV